MRYVSIATSISLGAALAVAVAAAPAAASDHGVDLVGLSFEMRGAAPVQGRAGAAEQLLSATATFSAANRADVITTPPTDPRHQFAMPGGSLSVTIDYGYHWETGALTYHYSLDTAMGSGDPDGNTRTLLGFGARDAAGGCVIEEATVAWLYRYIPDVLLYDNKDAPDLASAAGWSCAVLLVDSGPGTQPIDAFVAPLDVVSATPQLSVEAPRRDRLVKGVWTRIPVTVTNASPDDVDARDVRVVGAGKGVKVRAASFGKVEAQDENDGHVWAKLMRPKAKVRLAVTELGEVIGQAKVKLRLRHAPAPPKAGTWSAPGVSFTVRGRKVRGFSLRTQTTCGGYPDLPTTTTNTYSFQTEAIPRNNEVVGTERGNQGGDAAYTAYLELEFVSRTKVKGKFSYYGPARCTAFDSFTARRKR